MDRSWRCVTLSGFFHSHIVRCRWNPISCGTHYSVLFHVLIHRYAHPARAPTDQPFSRESSASPNLAGDRAARPVYDRWRCQRGSDGLSDAVCSHLAAGHSPPQWQSLVWYSRVYRPTRHNIGHFGDGGPCAVMCISHSVMESQWHNNPLSPRCFCLQRPKRDITHAVMEVAKALGGSFKLVMLAPKTVRETTQLLRET